MEIYGLRVHYYNKMSKGARHWEMPEKKKRLHDKDVKSSQQLEREIYKKRN